jgi:type VI secretion system protein ImpE
LAVAGDWDRSLTQLNVAGELDPAALPMVQTYREALVCEALREQVFGGSRSPLVFGDPEQWIALALQSVKLSGQGNHKEASQLREQAYELAPSVPGTINGEAFEWLADADSRIGPFVEAIIDGKYYWVPMHRIASMTVEAPEDLRDVVWIPAQFSWANGGQSIALLPVRYPDTHTSSDDSLRLSRLTEWDEKSADTFFGIGQRMMATDQADYSLLDIREIVFEVDVPEPEEV